MAISPWSLLSGMVAVVTGRCRGSPAHDAPTDGSTCALSCAGQTLSRERTDASSSVEASQRISLSAAYIVHIGCRYELDMKELVFALLTWICLQMGCEPPEVPAVRLVPQHQLLTLAYGPAPPEQASVTALYQASSRTVYLSETWKASDLANRATLVHELVHHVQETTAMKYPCLAAREALAYHVQARFLKDNGIANPYAFMQIDEFTIAVLSMCPTSE